MNITIGKPWAVSEKGGRLNNEDSIFLRRKRQIPIKTYFWYVMVSGELKKERLQVR